MNTQSIDSIHNSCANLNEVVIEKSRLLDIIKDNRDKHDALFEAAVEGYWVKAEEVLSQKQEKFANSILEVTSEFERAFAKAEKGLEEKDKDARFYFNSKIAVDNSWPLNFPENHSEDYKKAIAMIELSVFDKVKLSSDQFDAYVLNNWAWKNSFSASNINYISLATGLWQNQYISGLGSGFSSHKMHVAYSGINGF